MEKLSNENQSKLSIPIHLIDEIVKVGNIALEKFPTDEYELEIFVFLNYLERFVYNLDSINILLKTYHEKPNVETSWQKSKMKFLNFKMNLINYNLKSVDVYFFSDCLSVKVM